MKLKKCACLLVRYCSVKCQRDHRPQHKRECKKRVAELEDEILFKQLSCCLPLSIEPKKSLVMPCCGKEMYYGCYQANIMREHEQRLDHKCAFCRHPDPKSQEEANLCLLERAQANDPVAMARLGGLRIQMGDYKRANLGNAKAHYQLSTMYYDKDVKKRLHHLKEAANLAMYEKENGRHVRAARHLIISTKLGDYNSLERLKLAY